MATRRKPQQAKLVSKPNFKKMGSRYFKRRLKELRKSLRRGGGLC